MMIGLRKKKKEKDQHFLVLGPVIRFPLRKISRAFLHTVLSRPPCSRSPFRQRNTEGEIYYGVIFMGLLSAKSTTKDTEYIFYRKRKLLLNRTVTQNSLGAEY